MTGDLARFASSFDATSLSALERRAGLDVRVDRKYIVDVGLLTPLADALAESHAALNVAGTRVFAYETAYFDSPDLVTYRHHLQRRRRRFKCRTRLYAHAGLCFFEIKLRDGRDRTVKRKLALDPDAHGMLTPAALEFLEATLGEEYGSSAPSGLAPVLSTGFVRSTLVAAAGAERVTLDTSLSFAAEGREGALLPGRVLVETKTANGNGLADRVLRRLGARPADACSKYCVGMALLHPDLRRNRFSRVLRQHFAETSAIPTSLAA